ncbi:hypothetical protein Tco_0396695 [Tanacetum coccineum]
MHITFRLFSSKVVYCRALRVTDCIQQVSKAYPSKPSLPSLTWFKWNKVLTSKEKGGLGVSSLFALNRGLLFKWLWRFYSQKDSLWTKVIKALYGEDGSLDKVGASAARTCWTTIVQEVKVIQAQGINIHDFIKLKLGNGEDSRFWLDKWYEGGVLKRLFPRVYALLPGEALERVFKATLELLVSYKDQVAGIMYVSMPSYSGVFICLEAAKEEPEDDNGMDDGLETDDGKDDRSDNDMGDDVEDGDEADSPRLQRLAAQAKSFRPADDDDDDFSDDEELHMKFNTHKMSSFFSISQTIALTTCG